jgi:hypothetical protein
MRDSKFPEIQVNHIPGDPEEIRLWNMRRAQKRLRIHLNMRASNLAGRDISTINLRHANLTGSNLRGSILRGVDLSWTNLEDSDFSGAILEGANLSYADMTRANFFGANLTRANLFGANIASTNFRRAILKESNFGKVRNLDWQNLAGAIITGSTLKLPKSLRNELGQPLEKSNFLNIAAAKETMIVQPHRIKRPKQKHSSVYPPEFSQFFKWIDYCLHPVNSPPADIFRPITNDARILSDAINQMISKLNEEKQPSQENRRCMKLLMRRLNKIQRAAIDGHIVIIEKLNWELLPPGEMKPYLFRYLERSNRRRKAREIDFGRIEKILTLNPSQIFIGKHEFSGYIVFRFSFLPVAVLDHPVVGNALYILSGDWESLSKLTKGQLLESQSQYVRRIIHNETWLERLRKKLGLC